MGKQRTPQGRQTGRGTPPRKPPVAPMASPAVQAAPETGLPVAFTESHVEPLHAHLLDTVSPDALGAATPEPVETAAEAPVTDIADFAEISATEAGPAEGSALPVETPAAEPAPEPAEIHASEPASTQGIAVALDTVPVDIAPAEAVPAAPIAQAAPAVDPYANVVPLKSAVPVRAVEPAEPAEAPAQPSDGALPAPSSWRAGRNAGAAVRQDLEGLGETLFAFVRNEGTAALAHLAALKDARSPADAIRLQVSEIQRAADASLTCWSEIARRATRIVAQR